MWLKFRVKSNNKKNIVKARVICHHTQTTRKVLYEVIAETPLRPKSTKMQKNTTTQQRQLAGNNRDTACG